MGSAKETGESGDLRAEPSSGSGRTGTGSHLHLRRAVGVQQSDIYATLGRSWRLGGSWLIF
jgi:hypothetical protein